MLKVKDVAERLRLSPAKVYELVESGKLPHFRMDGAIRVSEDQLSEYLESCRHGRRQDEFPPKLNPRLKHIRLP